MSDATYIRQGKGSMLNISTPTVVKAVTPDQSLAQARVVRLSVTVAGTTPGTVNDCATVAAAAIANQIAVIPNTAGSVLIDFPLLAGLVVVPGTGQTVGVTYD